MHASSRQVTILFLEDLGFCKKGEGGAFVSGGRIGPNGSLAVNTNGGGLSYCHPGMYDVIWVYGYGWPVWRGGPMHYADRVGLPYIRGRLAEIAARAGNPKLEPSPLLTKLAQRGGTFAGFKKAAQ